MAGRARSRRRDRPRRGGEPPRRLTHTARRGQGAAGLSSTDEAAARALLQAVLPGLVALARRRYRAMGRGQATVDDVLSDVLGTAWPIIRRYPAHRTSSPAANIIQDTLHALVPPSNPMLPRQARPEDPSVLAQALPTAPSAEDAALAALVAPARHQSAWPVVIDDAWHRGVITEEVAELIVQSRVAGHPVSVLAARAGTDPGRLYRRRAAGEKALRQRLARAS